LDHLAGQAFRPRAKREQPLDERLPCKLFDPCKGIYYALYYAIHYVSLYWVHPPVRYGLGPWVATVTQGSTVSIEGKRLLTSCKGIGYA
jgi:hypothetical protein